MEQKTNKKIDKIQDVTAVVVVAASLYLLVSWFGRGMLLLFGYKTPNSLYCFIFGIGIIAAGTLLASVIQETFNNGGTNVKK